MSQANIVELAQSGDATAIAALMNASLRAIGIQARATLKDHDLYVLLESDQALMPQSCVEFIRRGMTQLGLGELASAIIYSRPTGQTAPEWVERIDLTSIDLTSEVENPFVLPPDAPLEVSEPVRQAIDWLSTQRIRLFNLLLLSVPLLIVLSSGYIWNRYLIGKPILPSTSQPARPSAAPVTDPYLAGYQHARNAAQLTQAAQTKEQATWKTITEEWAEAIALMKAVPLTHPRFTTAQQKVAEYQRTLAFVKQAKLSGMQLQKVITGGIAPRSLAISGNQVLAPNGVNSHTVTVFDRQSNLVKTISDRVTLAKFGYPQFKGTQTGDPQEAATTPDGRFIWLSNEQMSGEGIEQAPNDRESDHCSPAQNHPSSFVYRLSTGKLQVDRVVRVGAAPKSLAVSPNNRLVLASNWCSWDVSVIDTQTNQEVRRIAVGPYPRGIAIDPNTNTAYVAVLGSNSLAAINLTNFAVTHIRDVGSAPHQLLLDPSGKFLYIALSQSGQIAKLDLTSRTIVQKVATGSAPRSLALSADGQYLYVANYGSDTLSKLNTQDLQVVQTVAVNSAPIGVTYDPQTRRVWVACASGSILVFQD